MGNRKLRFLALATSLFSLVLLVLLFSAISPVKAGPPLQEPEEEEQQQPVEPFVPQVFPEEPGEDEEMDAQGGVQPAAYILNPTMNYQGYLADAGGSPINATLNFTAALFDDTSGGTMVWGPEDHPGVQVQGGLFNLALGQNLPLDPGDFWNALYLEIGVDGTVLPRQTLRTVPYAFSLVPGAYVRGDLDTDMVRFRNDGDDFALWAQENGTLDYGLGADKIYSIEGYASGSDSYLWVPGNLAVTNETDVILYPFHYGKVRVNTSWVGVWPQYRDVYIPIAIPGRLYGHDVVVEEVRVYYYTSDANNYIDSTYVRKLMGAGSYATIATENANQDSTTATSYPVPIDASSTYTLTSASGPLSVALNLRFNSNAEYIHIGGVRVRLGHPRSDL